MKALVCKQPGTFEYIEAEMPLAEPGRAILKVHRIGICGTDLHAFEGTQPYFEYPRILGHELGCEVVSVDESTGFAVGERVTLVPYFNCGECVACRNELPNCCAAIRVFGVHVDGGMKEFISVPVAALLHGGNMSFDELALVEPLAIGAHGIRRAGVRPGEYVLVIGAGPIGLGIMEFGRIAGAHVIAMDVNDTRLNFCKDKLKVAHTINPLKEDVVQRLKEITNNDMPTVVIDATGNQKAINSAFLYMAHGARYVLVGLQKGELIVSHPEFHKREATLMSSRNATQVDFDHVMQSMQQKLVNPATYITHRVAFDDVKDNFESWLDPKNGVIKAMVEL
ncbi:MAG TPA: zinc-binding alcohol dehydrogenase family protein [Phnomibacter sp.]|nr:zinc-binding alcohol dehydrogenase family protein [Phnomibacter sp.]